MEYCDCNCRNYAPLISKYLVSEEDDVAREPQIDKRLVRGKLPNYGRLTTGHDGTYVNMPDNQSNMESIVREGYNSPIKLDTHYKTGDVRLVRLDVDNKNGSAKLVPLEIDDKTGKEKLITLDVNPKTGEAHIARLDVDYKTRDPKLVGLDVPSIPSTSKLVLLEVTPTKGEGKLVTLDVDPKTRKATLVPLNVTEIEVDPKVIGLDVTNKQPEPKILMLDTTSLIREPKLVELEVGNKEVMPKLIPLEVDEIKLNSKIVTLMVDKKTSTPKVVDLNVTPITGNEKLVRLDVNPITGEPKVIPLEVTEKIINPTLVTLNVNQITGETKLVPLDVTPKSGEARLVELNVDPKTGSPKLVPLHVDPKSGEAKLVELEVTEKTREPKLIELDIPEKLGKPKLVMLEVDPKTGSPKLVPLHVDPKSGEAKLVELNVDPKTGSPKLVELEVTEKTREPKLVLLEVTPKIGEAKIIPLEVPEKLGEAKLVKLEIDDKTGKAILVPIPTDANINESVGPLTRMLNVDSKELPDGTVVDLPSNVSNEINTSKYNSYIPGTEIPIHTKSAGSMIKSESNLGNRPGLNLTPEAKAKYEATAAWMGIPGRIGVRAAQDYESIIGIYNSLDYQLGGGNEAIERIKSYLTASVSGKGSDFTKGIPSHELEGLENNSLVRTSNAIVRNTVGSSDLGSRITGAGLSILGGDINGAIKSIFGKTGEAKAEAIHDTLRLVRDAYNKLLISTKTEPGRLPGIEGNSAVSKLVQGDLLGAAKDAAGQVIKSTVSKLLGINNTKKGQPSRATPNNHPDARNVPVGGKGNPYEEGRTVDPGADLDNGNITFSERMNSEAMTTTLREVIGTSESQVGDVTALRTAMNNTNSLITNYQAHLNSGKSSGYKYLGDVGLDSNHVWALSLEPLISNSLNGGYTFLPGVDIMSYENKNKFNIFTDYNRWLPWTSFELQSTKMTGKSIGLFDGGVMFPVGMEFANELRVTLVDDSLKTFRRYFDTVAKVSVYKSKNLNNKSSFGLTLDDLEIDETKPHVSCYKNITFKLVIYIMNGEYMTIKKFPLLVVLNDYQTEYSGEVESGSGDINLHFSIVGEDDDPNGDNLVSMSGQILVKNKASQLRDQAWNEKWSGKAIVNNSTSFSSMVESPSTIAKKPIVINYN